MRPRLQFFSAGLSLVVLALLATDLYAWSGNEPLRRSPVPEASAQAAAIKVAKAVYGDEYAAAKTAVEKQELAKKLLFRAGEIQNDLPGRYVLARLSRDIAIQAGDVDAAFSAVDTIDHFYDVNGLGLKREVLVKLAALARTPAEHKGLVEKGLALFDQAVAQNDFPVATQVGRLAVEESAKSDDQDLARQVQKRTAEIEQLKRNFENRKSLSALSEPQKSKAGLGIKGHGPEEVAPLASPAGSRPSAESKSGGGDWVVLEDYRRWQVKGDNPPLFAELKKVERTMVVLKKKADGELAKVAFDDLGSHDQEIVSDWTMRESDRIWERGAEKIGPREYREAVRCREMTRELEGACVRAVFFIDQVSSTEEGKGAKLNLSGQWGFKLKEIVLPLPQEFSARISGVSRLVVLGKLRVKYTVCPACGGTGQAKCTKCNHGLVLQKDGKLAKCPQCKGTGLFGECQQHKLQAWEPFGTRKLPQGSFFTFTATKGARRVCFALDEPRFQILSKGSVITLGRVEGKIDIQTAPAEKSSQ